MIPLGREIPKQTVDDIKSTRRLLPTESDFKGKKGYYRKYRPDGSYDWGYRYNPNAGRGRLSKEGAEVGEMMAPFTAADTARQARIQGAQPKVRLRDSNGGVRFVDPALAGNVARQRGWNHAWRAGGIAVERGVGGSSELWRHYADGTREPTGRWCLTTPQAWARVPEDGNPDGTMRNA